eukprot:3906597-Pleurochrysis_carterae.AAC.3
MSHRANESQPGDVSPGSRSEVHHMRSSPVRKSTLSTSCCDSPRHLRGKRFYVLLTVPGEPASYSDMRCAAHHCAATAAISTSHIWI